MTNDSATNDHEHEHEHEHEHDHDHDHDHDHIGRPPVPPPGPIAQSVAIGFRAVYVAALVLTVIWLTSNVREIASDSQAVVRRFGRIVRAQEAGLLVAWPRPIEQVQLLPGPQRLLSQDVAALPAPSSRAETLVGRATAGAGAMPENVGAYLTGDGNVVVLSASLIYRINDPMAYALAENHVSPALDRLFRATTARVTAGNGLNDFLVVQTDDSDQAGDAAVTTLRAEVRESLLTAMNARLKELEDASASLGVEIERIDMTAYLPPEAKTAFDAVLLATQAADRGIANARTDAERRRQEAARERERLLSAAQATAKELVSKASVDTARIVALEQEQTPRTRPSLLLRQYRGGISDIVQRAGSVSLVDPQSGARFVLPGKEQ
jgi:regulator of protease activity HflC (stomatin/prohibitin superfamily)